jgi:cell wall-associated NlpC family hydrolase
MKWTIIILVVLILGWKLAVFWINRNEIKEELTVTDTLQAKTPVSDSSEGGSSRHDSIKAGTGQFDTITKKSLSLPIGVIDTKGTDPQQLVNFAKTLMGVPYLYGSTDPAKGFDCSGFITYVFKHFNIAVPRSSIDFTNVGKEVSAAQAKAGDLVLFTGTDSTERFIGHMVIVVSNTDSLRFIHSTSGKKYGVTITSLNNYYQGRYVKTIRVFPQNG